jgi:hypothetical protein
MKSLALVFSGIVIGCGAAATVGASWAGPQPGQWTCYDNDQAPDVAIRKDETELMNKVARSAPVGSVFNFQVSGTGYSYLCVRD